MKKNIHAIILTLFSSFALTLMYFAYRYMWFSQETIPSNRITCALIGAIVFGFVLLVMQDGKIQHPHY